MLWLSATLFRWHFRDPFSQAPTACNYSCYVKAWCCLVSDQYHEFFYFISHFFRRLNGASITACLPLNRWRFLLGFGGAMLHLKFRMRLGPSWQIATLYLESNYFAVMAKSCLCGMCATCSLSREIRAWLHWTMKPESWVAIPNTATVEFLAVINGGCYSRSCLPLKSIACNFTQAVVSYQNNR